MTSRHYLQAYINKIHGPSFRVVCAEPTACRAVEGNNTGCIYKNALQVEQTLDMVGWPPEFEHIMGQIELVPVTDVLSPRSAQSISSMPPVIPPQKSRKQVTVVDHGTPEPVPTADEYRHGDETT